MGRGLKGVGVRVYVAGLRIGASESCCLGLFV